ncbi:TatD family hydrolase [Stenotrophomonas maltophilia]|nr:TatD family hydrolase [Stenotrophomonas maltophilia]MBH1436918.1 TatD family hydrolase [Stenotrophomonas maltophilia]
MSILVDSHCHLDASGFDRDRAAVIERAQAAGVRQQVVPAVTAASWPKLREVCQQAPGLYPAYGLHPMFLADHQPGHLPLLREWIERERPCAIGECGLDFFVEGLDTDAQQAYFIGQLELAREFELPVIVHARRAVDAVIAAIRRVGGLRGVVHSFSGSPEQAAQLHRQGFLLGLGGPLTYDRAQRLQRLVREMPLEQLLLETDAPDQPDAGIRGQRNEPARLATIARHVAALRGMELEAVAQATTENARRLFALPVM